LTADRLFDYIGFWWTFQT